MNPSLHDQGPTGSVAALLAALEEISRARPDRVLRLRGELPVDGLPSWGLEEPATIEGSGGFEAFELLIFRGFSSLTTHPTAFDPDRPALPEGSRIMAGDLLQGPLKPAGEVLLAGPVAAETFLVEQAWH